MTENSPLQIRDERQLKALTGVTKEQFDRIAAELSIVYEEERQAQYNAKAQMGERKRQMGGGRKSALESIEIKLLFLLYYLKNYPTFDTLGSLFKISRSKACENIHKLMPLLQAALQRLNVLPHRKFESAEQFQETFKNVPALLIDVTDRARQRPVDEEKQSDFYSGKHKNHTVKNTIIATPERVIHYVGATMAGHTHDYSMLKEEFPPESNWFGSKPVYVDKGYTGILNQYEGDNTNIPYRKPRKSKNNPDPKLTEEQKEHNSMVNKARVYVENSISGIKRYNILVHDFRNKRNNFIDDVIAICAGLWNMMLGANVAAT